MEHVKLGIVGLGRLGRNHAANIHYHLPNAELTAICSMVEAELDSVGAEMQPRYQYTDYREMFQNREIDGVVIATPAETHFTLARVSLRDGMHGGRTWGEECLY